MTFLDEADALTHRGSLLSEQRVIVASWDLEQQERIEGRYLPLSSEARILNAARAPFRLSYQTERAIHTVHLINGMGVTLGDSIIGLTALDAIRRQHPQTRFIVYRPALAPTYVEALYQLSDGVVMTPRALPFPLDALPANETCIDVGNQLFWPAFASMPMIDFFLWALGVEPSTVPAEHKSNDWLRRLDLPALPAAWQGQRYVLFCPTASTPVRSIPAGLHAAMVERLWQRWGLPVLGFGAVDHPRYANVAALSPDTASFLAWAKGASFVLTADTAAVHIAAGFGVPTTAFFTTIAPVLRVRDYARCTPVTLPLPDLQDMHASGRTRDLERVEAAFRKLTDDDILLPELSSPRPL